MGGAKENHSFLAPSRIWRYAPQLGWVGGGGQGRAGKNSSQGTPQDQSGLHCEGSTQIIEDDSLVDPPNWHLGFLLIPYPQLHKLPPIHVTTPMATSLCDPQRQWAWVQIVSEHMQEASQIIFAFCDESLIIIGDLLLCWNWCVNVNTEDFHICVYKWVAFCLVVILLLSVYA